MSTALVQLGKIGDVLSMLPIAQNHCERTGDKPTILICSEFAAPFLSLPFANVEQWPHSFNQLGPAIIHAKKHFDNVIVTQTHAIDINLQKRHPSFQLDQWDRAGMLNQWDKLPLTLPRPAAEMDILNKYADIGRPFILYGDHSQSSPFNQREELYSLLVDEFGESHDIIRLSEIRMDNVLDLLALYDHAALLVSIETVHLHLCKASKVPTVALVTDVPTRWHGSAWSSRYLLHVRYSDFERRKGEIVSVIQDALDGTQSLRSEFLDCFPTAYNPSVVNTPEGMIKVARFHSDPTKWPTKLVIRNGVFPHDAPKTIQPPQQVDGNSIEDPKLFYHNGHLFISYVVSLADSRVARCAMGYGRLECQDGAWKIVDHVFPKYRHNDYLGVEKNWVWMPREGRLFAIYQSQPDQIVLEIEGDKVVAEHKSPPAMWKWGEIRGDAIVDFGDRLLRIFHSRVGTGHKHYEFRYYLGAAWMEAEPPFNTLQVSSRPIMAGDERYSDTPRWKPNVLFAGGAYIDRGSIVVSYGQNDCQCRTVRLTEKDLNL